MARHPVAVVVAGLVGAMALADAAYAQGPDDLARLRTEVSRLHGQGKYADAILVAERYVASARQKHGEEHTEFATATGWLAFVHQGHQTFW